MIKRTITRLSILIIMVLIPWNYRLAAQHTDDISQQEMQQARDNIRQKLILDNKEFREEAEKYARLDDLDFLLIDSATVEDDWVVYYFYPVSDSKFKRLKEKEGAYFSEMRSYYINNPDQLYEYIAARYGFCFIIENNERTVQETIKFPLIILKEWYDQAMRQANNDSLMQRHTIEEPLNLDDTAISEKERKKEPTAAEIKRDLLVLNNISRSINMRCPIRIDADTYLDSTGISDQHFIYYFSISAPTSPTNVDIMRDMIRINLRHGDPSVKQLVSLCIETNNGYCHRYHYQDSKSKGSKKAKMKTGKEILDICFSVEELQEIRNYHNLWSH
ncbi:MAG: hypothetical protein K6G70_11205 [Bacteroidaceae bacterium]|nr:hypothetical protein [Bacteroidaceae bacterium]